MDPSRQPATRDDFMDVEPSSSEKFSNAEMHHHHGIATDQSEAASLIEAVQVDREESRPANMADSSNLRQIVGETNRSITLNEEEPRHAEEATAKDQNEPVLLVETTQVHREESVVKLNADQIEEEPHAPSIVIPRPEPSKSEASLAEQPIPVDMDLEIGKEVTDEVEENANPTFGSAPSMLQSVQQSIKSVATMVSEVPAEVDPEQGLASEVAKEEEKSEEEDGDEWSRSGQQSSISNARLMGEAVTAEVNQEQNLSPEHEEEIEEEEDDEDEQSKSSGPSVTPPLQQQPQTSASASIPTSKIRSELDSTPTRLLCKLRVMHQLHAWTGYRRVDLETIRFSLQNKQVSTLSLFVEVIARGGRARVTSDRKWTEIAQLLNCLVTHNSGMTLKQKYDDIGLSHLEADAFLLEEIGNYASQEAGARQASLPPRALTPIELLLFPEYGRDAKPHERERYLDARDHVLQRWCLHAERSLSFEEDILVPLLAEFDEQVIDLFPLEKAFFAMETLGYMNWGCLENVKRNHSPSEKEHTRFIGGDGKPKRFVVVGAGLAGLACALQLSRFGHEVRVVEGRNRVGGRVYTDTKTFSAPVDLGAMLITGVQGHPASVLTHQLRQKKYAVGDACPIFSLGELLDPEMDERVETRFNAMLTAAAIAARADTLQSNGLDAGEEGGDEDQPVHHHQQQPATITKESRKRGRSNQYSSLQATFNESMRPESLQEPRSKYSGVYWNPETGRWRVCLTRMGSGAVEWFSGKEFDDELDAAAFHDSEFAKKSYASSTYSDVRNADLYPGDFETRETNIDKHPRLVLDSELKQDASFSNGDNVSAEKLDNTITATTTSDQSERLKQFGAECLVLAQREIDRLKRPDKSPTALVLGNLKRLPLTTKDSYSLMERMLEEDASVHRHLSEDARRLEDAYLSWHFANLEYACAASLARVSAANWDQDDEHDWEGSHVMLPNGFGALTEGMKRSLLKEREDGESKNHVHLGHRVMKISAKPEGNSVSVFTEDGTEFVGDAVVCTVSLGILKEGLLQFDPPLPNWKLGAISRLGYGNLNKVTFEFDRVFWGEQHDIFGRVVHPHIGSRGECFMFWCLNKLNPKPIILALVAGDAAEEQEFRPDDVIAKRALAALRETFPGETVPEPIAHAVTRWRADKFSRGTYSFVAVGSSGEDYSLMAEQTHDARVFFAGEATCREHPATTGGSLLSGLREAAKIAAKFGRLAEPAHKKSNESMEEILRRIGDGLSLRPGKLSPEKMAATEKLLSRMAHGKIWTARDFDNYQVPRVQTEDWSHIQIPLDFLQTNRERALRAQEILPRLPESWDQTRKMGYLVQRLGIQEWTQGEEVGLWV